MPAAPYPYIEITRGGFFAIHNLDDKLLEEVTIMLEERISTIEEEIRCHQLTELQHSIHLSTPHSMDSTIYQVRLNSLTQEKLPWLTYFRKLAQLLCNPIKDANT